MIRIKHCDFEERKQMIRSQQTSKLTMHKLLFPMLSLLLPIPATGVVNKVDFFMKSFQLKKKLSAEVLSGCQLKEKSKVYDGTHLQTIRWSSLEGCAAACAEKNACSVFYFSFFFKRCYLYRKGEIRNTTSSVTAGFCPKGRTLEFQITFDVFQGDPIKE